ncbi:MAG: MaoC family dehydratase [Myxococcales bacterium]|nr:MaoC family dehydratase [Myxococcales bacterium]MDH5305638.1 MaoC family dehydratase [Myxococcales bacterium]MDH5565131.1 MaoC family dehydratase [Myxococcales bacterium]
MRDETLQIGSPYFEDLKVGQVFDAAPAVTLTSGHAALHEAVFGDRLRLPLDAQLSRAVTGAERLLANPNLVCNIAIGQTTEPSGRVMGNLFYRGLVLQRPAFLGDTLRTTTKIVALRQNRPKPGRAASGMAVFEVHVENQHGETVLHFWRCPMLPCRDPEARTGHADSFEAIPSELDMDQVRAAAPRDWRLDRFRERCSGSHFADAREGARFRVEGRDTVSCAPEIARMTLNVARAHTDAAGSAYRKRLVYGGHTISIAASQIVRALPNLVTFVAWRSCDHTAPVFEGDVLRTEFALEAKHALESGGGLVDLHAHVFAERGAEAPAPGDDVAVLDWRVVGWMA